MGVDLPDEVAGRVGDVGVALEVHRDVVRDLTCPVADVIRGEGGKEEALARAEVVGSERVEFGERGQGVNIGEEAVVDGVDGEADNGDVFGEGRVGD